MDSKLQIISGKYKGRHLNIPLTARPTQNKARIALFNMLDSGIINDFANELFVWDAFAGTGALGIECLSRYQNSRVLFTDTAPESIKTIRDNLAKIDATHLSTVIKGDAISCASKYAHQVNFVFVDPPYHLADLGRVFINKLSVFLQTGAVVVWEQETDRSVNPDTTKWTVLRDKTYGRARFLILQKN